MNYPSLHIMGNSVSLEEELINLRMTSKSMQRSAKKCEKNEKAAVDKVKKVRGVEICDGVEIGPVCSFCRGLLLKRK